MYKMNTCMYPYAHTNSPSVKWNVICEVLHIKRIVQFSHSVMSDSVILWTAACQASLSITKTQSLLKFMSVESMMPSNHLILCRPIFLPPLIFPSIRVFPMSQFFASGGQSIGVSASASVLPMIFRTDFV